MAQDLERLTISLEANIKKFENEMKRARGVLDKQSRTMEQQTEGLNTRLTKIMGKAGAGMGAALVGGLAGVGVAGAFEMIRGAVSDLTNTLAEAKRAGLGVEQFQELSYAARQSSVSMDALTDGLKEMALRADEFIVTGAGSGEEAFKRLGYSAEELRTKLKDPVALFEEIINKLGQLDRSAQIRIADEIFGGQGGEQFVRFLDKGADAIARARREARETGNVLSEDVMNQAAEIDRKFNDIASTIGTKVKGAIVSLIGAMREFSNALSESIKVTTDAPQVALAKTQGEIDAIRSKIEEHTKTNNRAIIGDLQKDLADAEKRAAALKETVREVNRANGLARATPNTEVYGPPIPANLGGLGDLSQVDTKGSAKRALEGYAALRQAAQARIDDLRTEQAALGLTTAKAEALRFANELLADATREGTVLTQGQRQEILQLAAEYGTLSAELEEAADKQDAAAEQMREFQSLASNGLQGFISDLREGKSAAEALGNMLDRVADKLISMSLDSLFDSKGGGLGGLLSNLFQPLGPKLATGGHVKGPGTGTSDSILARLSNGEFVMNAKSTRKYAPLLEAMNAGRLPGFASGGFVGVPGNEFGPEGGFGEVLK